MSAAADHDETISLVEETLHIEKHQVVTGRVRIKIDVDELQESSSVNLDRDVVEIGRIAIGREVSVAPEIRTENGITIIPVVEEVVVVEKRLRLVEEIHVRRRTEIETVEIPVSLRKQRAVIENIDTSDKSQTEGE